MTVSRLLTSQERSDHRRSLYPVEDLVASGVIDPAKVTKNALQNASSIAGLMLTTEALVCEIPEEKEKGPAMPGGGMGDMY